MINQRIATQNIDAFLDSVRVEPEGWDKIVFEFCKVDFLCWHGEPNWLGWILIGIGALILFVILLNVVTGMFHSE